jgi:chromosome partitioning protein
MTGVGWPPEADPGAQPLGWPTHDVSRETSTPGQPDVSRETSTAPTPIGDEALAAVKVASGSAFEQLPRPRSTRIIALANQKGGVGKTTTAVNLAAALGMAGQRVLVIDLDPQGNASTGLGVRRAGQPSTYEALLGDVPLAEVIVPVPGISGVDVAPATISLAGAEIELVSLVAREYRLRRAVEALLKARDYDYVMIDCPPSLSLLTVNALSAATEVLVPIQCEYYALEGVSQLMDTIDLVKNQLNPELTVSTVVLTMFDARTRLADDVAADVRRHFGDRVVETVVPRSVRLAEAPGYGQTIFAYDAGSRGAQAYLAVAREVALREPSSERKG